MALHLQQSATQQFTAGKNKLLVGSQNNET